jgi:hypothetical protein
MDGDFISFNDYQTATQKAIWTFGGNTGYTKGISFLDTATFAMQINNVGGFFQKNAANTAGIRMIMVDDQDRILLGGSGPASRVAAFNELQVTNGGYIWNEGNTLNLGKNTTTEGSTVYFNAENNNNAYFSTPLATNYLRIGVTDEGGGSYASCFFAASGNRYFRAKDDISDNILTMAGTKLAVNTWAGSQTKNFTVNGTSQLGTGADANANPIVNIKSNAYNADIFVNNVTPEGLSTATVGSMALTNTGGNGAIYGKYSGSGNTGWGKMLNLIDPLGATTGMFLKWNGATWLPDTVSGGGGGSGITSLNGLTASTQTFATGTTGTDFNISSTGSAHTFNIPDASASATGKVNTTVQTFAGVKTFQNDVICQDELRVSGGVLDVGANATTPGVINVYGATSGAVQIAVPAAPTTYVFTLPPDDGTAGQVLTTDGTGTTSWAATGGSPVVITPPNITATQNNYSPTGWSTATVVFLSTDGTEIWGITGFSSSGLLSGHTKRLVNTSKAQIYITPNHPSSSSVNRITAAQDFILGYGKSVDIVFNGSTWFLLGESASPTVYLRWNPGSTTAADWGDVVFTAINSGTVTSTTGPDATTPYMQNMTTAATTNGGGSISMSKTSTKFARINTGHMFIESSLKTPSVLSDATDSYMCGTSFGAITASSVLNSTNCIMIRYIHSLNSGNWTLTTINSGGTPTDVDLGVAVAANTRYNLRIEVSDDGLEARAFINGEMKGVSTTTMPANTAEFLAKTQLLKTAGTSDRSMGIISLETGVHIKY